MPSETPAEGRLKRSASQRRLVRSNSVERDGSTLMHSGRKWARLEGGSGLTSAEMNDFSSIAIYSREAYENFGRTWQSRMKSNSLERATKSSRKGVSVENARTQLDRLGSQATTASFEEQVQALMANRGIPHVIAVIEGKNPQRSLALRTKVSDEEMEIGYTHAAFNEGHNAQGLKDHKQSMTFYVRNDLKSAYSISSETIRHGTEEISCAGINYETADGTLYRLLVVHVPNRFVGTEDAENVTHRAFQEYAEKAAEQTPKVIVTGYVGDTNFKYPRYDNATPSMGGHLPSGDSLRPQSSGAKTETNFMQTVPLDTQNESKHVMLQGSTLNYVFPTSNAQNRESTDHVSLMSYTAHSSEIVGREPVELPEYYG